MFKKDTLKGLINIRFGLNYQVGKLIINLSRACCLTLVQMINKSCVLLHAMNCFKLLKGTTNAID